MHARPDRFPCMFLNPRRSPCQPRDRELIGQAHAASARSLLDLCPVHQATPLLPLPLLAADLDLAGVYLKAEWQRMGLSSFKALGGVHAVALCVLARAQAQFGHRVHPRELMSAPVRSVAGEMTMICASAGNHGLAVAAGARVFGARAVVVLGTAVAEDFAIRLRRLGATVIRAGASYEESLAHATDAARQNGWELVADSSWSGYTEVPLAVMRGYTVLLDEAANALDECGGPASHVFIQAGVGGLAAATAGYLRDRWGEGFRLVVIEPEAAPCLLESALQGRPTRVTGGTTTLGRLDCRQPSLLAFELLSHLADAFALVTDTDAETAALRLTTEGAATSACGAAGAAGLIACCSNPAWRRQLGLDTDSRVLLVGTEAANHPIEGRPT